MGKADRRANVFSGRRMPESGSNIVQVRGPGTAFDWTSIRAAYLAGDYGECRRMLESAPQPEAQIWLARMDVRSNRDADGIARLLKIAPPNERLAAERDIWLASAYTSSDRPLGHKLLDRALPVLRPYAEPYHRGLYIRSMLHFVEGEYDACVPLIDELLQSENPLDRAQAYSHRSWISAKHEDLRSQLDDLERSLEQHLRCDPIDQYAFSHMLVSLAALCRELSTHGVIERLRHAVSCIIRSEITEHQYFSLLRILGWINALQGDEISALRLFNEAETCAPSAFWRVFSIVDRAELAHAMARKPAAREALATADEQASSLQWSSTKEDERIILVTIAQLYARDNPARAQMYLAKFRSLRTGMHGRLGWVGDRRTRALQLSANGSALLALDEREDGIAMLQEAWEIFTTFEYDWRAARAALTLFESTNDVIWLERARKQIAPWPNSWIARRV